ncbi:MAG: tetratricopeptide repeat protein, partial [bacterium]
QEIHQVLLTGELGRTRAFEFFTSQFPDAKVQSFVPGEMNTEALSPEEIAIFPNFAIPIALAWRALDRKNPKFIQTDFVPNSIKEAQKPFKIAWHGVLLLGVIFVAMALISYQGLMHRNAIHSLKESIRLKQASIESLQPELMYINQLQNEANQYKSNLEFLDSFVVDPGKWSRLFEKLTQDFQRVNRIWIDHIESKPQGFTMVGRALSRDRIPLLAGSFPEVSLRRVTRIPMENDRIIYEFELDANIPPPAEEHDQLEAIVDRTTGTIESEIPSTAPLEETEQPVVSKPTSTPKNPPAVKLEERQPSQRANQSMAPVDAGNTSVDKSEAPANKSLEMNVSSGENVGLYQQAMTAVRANQPEKAIEIFASLVREYPNSPETPAAYYWLGECHYALGKNEAAAQNFETSLKYVNNSKRAAALLMLGKTWMRLKQADDAQRQFELLIAEYPGSEYAQEAKIKLKQLQNQ